MDKLPYANSDESICVKEEILYKFIMKTKFVRCKGSFLYEDDKDTISQTKLKPKVTSILYFIATTAEYF